MPFNVGAGEILLILLVALIILGPEKLPGAARQVGRTIGELRRLSSGFQADLKDALKEPLEGTPVTAASAPAPLATPLPVDDPPPPVDVETAVEAGGGDPEPGPLSAPKRPEPAEGLGANGAAPAN